MKRILLAVILGALFLLTANQSVQAGEVDILVQKLVEKNILSPAEASIILDETKLQVSKDLAQAKSLSVPEWTQRIKWGGDVRYRTQGDWAKKTVSDTPGGSYIKNQQWRNRVRGRFYLEGKVNDFTYAGARFAGGLTKANSTNDTLTNYWDKNYVMFDQYYMRFEAPSEMIRDYGKYFSDAKFWAGRFPIPFEYSEMVWDSDINPSGIAIQYVSPDIKIGGLPATNIYSNGGMLWLTENSYTNTDPILWALQIGAKTDEFGPFGTTLNFGTAIYNFANMQDKIYTGSQYTGSATAGGTNSRWWQGDGLSSGDPRLGGWKYGFKVLDLLLTIDNKKIMDYEFPHGFYLDFINNFGASNSDNQGYAIGGYIGKKKIKEPGDWKARAEYRYIGRDAIQDFMPDSDFYGFGTFTSNSVALNATGANGLPMEGGTNGKGINLAFEYQLFKNTALNIEYYWMKPIKSWDKVQPWNELQMDVVTKF